MRIAICDSDDCFCSMLENWLDDYSRLNIVKIRFEMFCTAERLISVLSNDGWFDLIFINLELTGTDGLELGSYIRNTLRNDRSSIVYLSNNNKIYRALFDSRPINFHIKPLNRSDIYRDVDTAMRLAGIVSSTFKFKHNGTFKGVSYGDIVYFSMEQKLVKLFTHKREYLFRGNLNEIDQQLPDNFFCRCHKSFIININYIVVNRSNCFILSNGEEIPVGRKYREYTRKMRTGKIYQT